MEVALQANGLKKTFTLSAKQRQMEKTKEKKKVAVNGLSFEAYRGEIFGLLGPNGAGKTTALRMIATLIRPDEGDILVDGVSVVKDPDVVRGRIGFLTSELKLEDFFTPDYLYDFFSELHGVEPEVAAKRKQELFEKFGIGKFAGVKVANLSTGMKQKASLVISVAHDPDIIIFDEPTNGLDNTARIFGTKGWVEIPDYWKARKAIFHLPGQEPQTVEFPCEHELIYEVRHIAECMAQGLPGSPVVTEALSVSGIAALEAVKEQW